MIGLSAMRTVGNVAQTAETLGDFCTDDVVVLAVRSRAHAEYFLQNKGVCVHMVHQCMLPCQLRVAQVVPPTAQFPH